MQNISFRVSLNFLYNYPPSFRTKIPKTNKVVKKGQTFSFWTILGSRSTSKHHEYSAVWNGCYDKMRKRKYETDTVFSILDSRVFLRWKKSSLKAQNK